VALRAFPREVFFKKRNNAMTMRRVIMKAISRGKLTINP
jgi:hypothetical protein